MKHEIERILAIGDAHKKPHWKVYHGTTIKQQQIYCSSDSLLAPAVSVSWDSSRPYLETYLNLIYDGVYTIHFKNAPDDNTGMFVETFKVTPEAAIGGVNQPPIQQQPQFNPQHLMQYMQAEIGRVTEQLKAQFTEQNYKREIDELKKKLKEKTTPVVSVWEPILKEAVTIGTTLLKDKMQTAAPKVSIGVSGDGSQVVPPVEKQETQKAENAVKWEVQNPELVPIYNQTIQDLTTYYGSTDEMIINLHCLSVLMQREKVLFDGFVVPKLAAIREELNLDENELD